MRLALNVATDPPAPARVKAFAYVSLAMALAAFAASSAGVLTSRDRLRSEEAQEARAVVPSTRRGDPPEAATLAAIFAAAPRHWTSSLAALERSFPAESRIERLEWREGVWMIRVVAKDEAALGASESAFSQLGRTTPISQVWREDGIIAEFRLGDGGG